MANRSSSTQCRHCRVYGHEKAAQQACASDAGKHYWEALTCLDHRTDGGGEPCGGDLPEYRFGYGMAGSYVRCGNHHASYLKRAAATRERYPDTPNPPADFDPAYAGEHWDEDY